jgi:hypothetical protein
MWHSRFGIGGQGIAPEIVMLKSFSCGDALLWIDYQELVEKINRLRFNAAKKTIVSQSHHESIKW